ncbi:protease IV [Marchantia polymorpha subsp. ruderalis]|uniref:Peptidase S49 domain-containing protein n=1 Tax=Marchantia polymorpha TaxID=3197 RepID=A0A2R6XMI2_MARPO|nr:hypothetical protein MARPO_0008s0093 [Marchantia polymorpha]BBN19507.1 hypothetical protein Mp_8g11270 [Marchantia polymorpha subsp. ruderalis]|eukprot:PTQ47321.1 hypothetical protein MARPO_0008s0093 [Marchantia polymorpha]
MKSVGIRHSSCSLQQKCLLVRSLLSSSSSSHSCSYSSSAVMSAASGGCVVSAIVPSSFQSSREIKAVTCFQGPKHGELVKFFPGTVRFKQTSGLLPYNADNRHFVKRLSIRALDETTAEQVKETTEVPKDSNSNDPAQSNGTATKEALPSGDLEYEATGGWDEFVTRCKMLIAFPWQRVKKGSVLKLKLSGSVTEQVQSRFSQSLSLPMLCQNLMKAAHDPRIAGVVLRIEPLDCGWGKIDEICRHIDYYKKSGKFLIGFMVVAGEKEYYLASKCGEIYAPPGAYISLLGLKVQATFLGGVFEKVGVEPQVQRIGKYKSAGDSFSRKDMSEANREMLTALLDDIYGNWVNQIALSRGKTVKDVEDLLDTGVFELAKLKEGGWITDIKYEDEVDEMLKERLGIKEDKKLKSVDYRKYSRVKEWTLGLSGGGDRIAVIRAVGGISRARGGGLSLSSEGIVSDSFIEKIRQVRDSKEYKAVVLRIDSPGGDALASDLMWREIKLLAAKKPVIASMVDVAASGGYYMAMACDVIIAESLTLTGSIGVITAKLNLGELYDRVGYNKEIISRGRFAELDAEQRSFKPEELEFFKASAQNAYEQFRNKAALSRSMEKEKMEEVAQGRVWTGKAAKDRGLVDGVGGFWRAIAVAKQKAGIASDAKVSLVELSRQQTSPLAVLRGGAAVLLPLIELAESESGRKIISFLIQGASLSEVASSKGIQARMDDITIDGLGLESRKDSSV